MSINFIAGKPGSGKTYWAVHHLVSKYFEWNKIHSEFMPKYGFAIVTNIDALRLDHYNLDEMIQKAGGVTKFFTVAYQKTILAKWNRIIYIIDEAGHYFPAKFNDEKVLAFFQFHRHLGLDFYLISVGLQDVVCSGITRIIEKRLQARPRSKKVMGEFKYTTIVEGDKAGTTVLRPDKKIFALYRSMEMEETEVVKSVVKKYIAVIAVLMLLSLVGFYYFLHGLLWGGKKDAVAQANGPVSRPVSSRMVGGREVRFASEHGRGIGAGPYEVAQKQGGEPVVSPVVGGAVQEKQENRSMVNSSVNRSLGLPSVFPGMQGRASMQAQEPMGLASAHGPSCGGHS